MLGHKRSIEMIHGRIRNESALRKAAQIRTLISDLDRIVQFLNFDIATEEKHAGVFDRSDVTIFFARRNAGSAPRQSC